MLHVSICCKLFVSKALLKGSKEMEIRGCKIRTVRIMAPNLPAVVTSQVWLAVWGPVISVSLSSFGLDLADEAR